ncbi:hypothetical protein [Marinobacterium stanieri]|uniref:hypothetical protein n=1 Tax=Marinobacterium stanieri TaxID=49186 RepID=UPI003A8EBBA9
MNQSTFNKATIGIALLSLTISAMAFYFSWSQHNADYEKTALIRPGMLPLNNIKEGKAEFNLEVLNTSKTNLQYYMRVDTNMGFLEGKNGKPQHLPFSYESQIVSLSKSEAGSNMYKHAITLNAQHGAVNKSPLAYISPAEYYLYIRVVDASNGRTLHSSKCFYSFHVEAKMFALDQPVIDTSGESELRQKECRA